MFEKHLLKNNVLSKYTDQGVTSYWKYHSPKGIFHSLQINSNSNKLPGFCVNGNLAINRII